MLGLGAIASLCYVPGFTGAAVATQWPVLSAVLPLAVFRTGPFTVFHGLWMLFFVYGAVRACFSVVPYDAVFGLWLTIIMGLSLWLGSTLTTLRGLYVGLAIGGAVSSAVAILQFAGLLTAVRTTSWQPSGLWVNSVQQGTVLALIIVALVSERMWLWVVPLVPGFVLAQSRGAMLALAVGLLACTVRRIWVFGIVAAAGCVYLFVPLSTSDQERMLIWDVAYQGLTWFGWGPRAFYAVAITQAGQTLYPGHAHNDFLQLAFEYGIGAALPLAVIGFALTRTYAREWPVIVCFAAAACYSMPLYMPVASFLAFVAMGRIVRDHALSNDHSRNQRSHVVLGFPPGARGAAVSVGPANTNGS